MIFRKYILMFFLFSAAGACYAQYPPAAGHPGTTAMYKDSTAFYAWATGCRLVRGWQDISDHGLGYASVGDSTMATGPAGTNGIVSLGDGGSAILTFDHPIVNGDSWDFAVFENSFDNYFLELAFVEVSSDGVNFFRFPVSSLTDTIVQVSSFDSLDAARINNLAGKYRGLYGTPFDLDEMKNIGGLDVDHITHVRIVDVVGSLQPAFATYDTAGRKINDPWPTPFASGGFDLDAVGVIWNTVNSTHTYNTEADGISVYPDPAVGIVHVNFFGTKVSDGIMKIFNVNGEMVLVSSIPAGEKDIVIDVRNKQSGLYILQFQTDKQNITKKLVIR